MKEIKMRKEWYVYGKEGWMRDAIPVQHEQRLRPRNAIMIKKVFIGAAAV